MPLDSTNNANNMLFTAKTVKMQGLFSALSCKIGLEIFFLNFDDTYNISR